MDIADLHCDTIMRLCAGDHLRTAAGHVNAEKLRTGGTVLQCFALFLPDHDDPEAYFEKAYHRYTEELALCADILEPVYSVKDIDRIHSSGKIGALLTVEDAVTLRGDLKKIDDYYSRGVRLVTLTWNRENSLGYPNSPDPDKHSLGLKPFGIEAVCRMNELGIAVDVSHLSEGGFWDVIRHSSKPVIASHSCSRALCDVSRNLTDRQLRAIGDCGGVVGMNYYARFLHTGPSDTADAEEVVRHILYVIDKAGLGAAALGSDYDGIETRLSWGDCSGQQIIPELLSAEIGEDAAELVCFGNVHRVLGDIFAE